MNVKDLLDAAKAETGLNDFGDESMFDPLGRLVDSLNKEAKLSERGQQIVAGSLTATLSNRLRIEDYLKQHPALLDQPIEKPLFVFGLPRTGTTLVINLLSVDPARRCFLRWEASESVPPPTADELHAGPRYERCQAKTDMAVKHVPHISAIHHEDADSPTECQFLMAPSFIAQVYDAMYQVPSYHKWFMHEADYLPAITYHKRFLQLLQANTGGRWTLKNPWHPLYLNELKAVYPDAQFVMTHRNPVDVLGSACSLHKAVRPLFSSEVDHKAIGDNLIATFDIMIERTNAYLEAHGDDAIYHLRYPDLTRDPIGELKKIYAHFNETWTPEAETAMQRHMAENPKGKHGRHEYSLTDYGLTDAYVRDHFREYCDRFGIE